uniref:hypothetical protein n=1 Tax=Salmonella sp. TaxID=599 RepID=UPI003995B216
MRATGAKRQKGPVFGLLRKSLGNLPVIPFTPREPLEITMTEWFKSGFLRIYSR